MAKNRLSALSLYGTASCLRSSVMEYSPAYGALLSLESSHLVGNLRFCPHVQSLANDFFYQRQDSNGRKFGPILPTKSKSKASYWLSPSLLGHLVGISMRMNESGSFRSSDLDSMLGDLGIECNYVNKCWTGVSLERFRTIIRKLQSDHSNYHMSFQSSNFHETPISGYTLPVILLYVWHMSTSKSCLLDYILALEKGSGKSLLTENFDYLREPNCLQSQQWIDLKFADIQLSPYDVERASHLLISANEYDGILSRGEALEIVLASLLRERTVKTPLRLGRYSYRGGKHKPDCVEVVIREIIESILYDPTVGKISLDRLTTIAQSPISSTSSPLLGYDSLHTFYSSYLSGEIDNVSVALQSAPTSSPLNTSSSLLGWGEWTSAGERWFQICSALPLPSTSYLSFSPDGRPYELKPTLRNVCEVLEYFLTNSQSSSWKSFATLEHLLQRIFPDEMISIDEKVLSYRAPFSDTEKITKEKIQFSFSSRKNGEESRRVLEIELEEAHGLATAKHYYFAPSSQILWRQNSSLVSLYQTNWQRLAQATSPQNISISDLLLYGAILGDNLMNQLLPSTRVPVPDQFTLFSLLNTRWGEDRRDLQFSFDSTSSTSLHSLSASQTNYETDTITRNDIALYQRGVELARNVTNKRLREDLVKWLVREIPPRMSTEEIAIALSPLLSNHEKDLTTLFQGRRDLALLTKMMEGNLMEVLVSDELSAGEKWRLLFYFLRQKFQ